MQRKKISIALYLISVGFIVACLYHYSQGAFFGQAYPYNTFLYNPVNRYSDYFDVIKASVVPDPYTVLLTVYFPFTYVFFKFIGCIFQPFTGLYLIFSLSSLTLLIWVFSTLKLLKLANQRRIISTVIIVGCSYPVLFCWDRGNIEIILLAFVVLFLYFFYNNNFWIALIFLLPAICMKLYPAALLALYLPKRQYLPIIIAGLSALLITLLSVFSFQNSIAQEIVEWQGNLAFFKANYLIGNGAMASGSSPWNIIKTIYIDLSLAKAVFLSQPLGPEWAGNLVFSLGNLLRVYSMFMLALAIYITWHVVFVEKDSRRQAILLLLFMVFAPAGGADYKMIYVVPVITLLMILPPRKYDFLVLLFIAIVLIPKKYFFIPSLVTDSGYADVSYAVYFNPLLLMLSMFFIIQSGWKNREQSALKKT